MAETALDKYLYQLRRIEEHREAASEKEIRKIYKQLLNELQAYMTEIYINYSEDDMLTYGNLAAAGMDARFLEEVEQRINDITPEVAREITTTVSQTYEACYDGMRNAVVKAAGSRELLQEAFKTVKAVTPDIIKQAINNPVSGLTLKDTLESHRKDIIYDIKRNIGVGLSNGDRFTTMAKRISDSLDGDYKKSIRVVRTEAHRVRESGYNDAATDIDNALKEGVTGMVMAKTWRTMKDERVRPNTMYKTKGGWKRGKKSKYDHESMEGVTIPQNELFVLPSGAKCMCPSKTGVAGEDINCRCYVSYDLVKASELTKVKDGKQSIEKAVEETEKEQKAQHNNVVAKEIEEANSIGTDNLLKYYDERRTHYNMHETPADEIRGTEFNPVKANYKGVSIDTANSFNRVINTYSQEYYSGLQSVTVGNPKEFFGTKIFATTRHNSITASKDIIINPLKSKDYQKMADRVKELSQKGYCVDVLEDKAGDYIATHEFAHTLFDTQSGLKNFVEFDTKNIRKARKELDAVFTKYKADIGSKYAEFEELRKNPVYTDPKASTEELFKAFEYADKIQKEIAALKISDYSLENADEFMAEAFTQAKIGKAQGTYSKEVMQIIDKYFRK